MKYYSSIDLTSAFWQIPLSIESRNLTAFQFDGLTFQFRVVPFGTKNSLAALAEALDQVLGDLSFVKCYVDDLLIFSETKEQHIEHLEAVFKRFRQSNITVNLEKSKFFSKELDFVGHKITGRGIEPQKDKLIAIQNFTVPANKKELRRFLGLTNYYAKFTKNYSHVTAKLGHLLKDKAKWNWGKEEDKIFGELKELFLNTVILDFPNFNVPFHLFCDSSYNALGAALSQYDESGDLRVIYFASRTLHGAEQSYTITELELLSVVWSVRKFHKYLAGKKFFIHSDHKALTFLNKCKDSPDRIRRWILFMQQYEYEIIHVPGKDNIVADVLSRGLSHSGNILTGKRYFLNIVNKKERNDYFRDLEKKISDGYRADGLAIKLLQLGVETGLVKQGKTKFKMEEGIIKSFKEGSTCKVYVPKPVQVELIKAAHIKYLHVGVLKLFQLIRFDFYIPRLWRLTSEVVETCPTCQLNKIKNYKNYHELCTIECEGPGQLVSCDFYGPLVRSTAGTKYIFCIIDNFSKYVKLYALRSITTASALRCLTNYVDEIGKPTRVLSDRGVQFTSKKWVEALTAMGIKITYSAIRHPQSNNTERTNRDLGTYFRILLGETHTGWAAKLKEIENNINNTYHHTIETTPTEVQVGEKPERPWSRLTARNGSSIDVNTLREEVKKRIIDKGRIRKERFKKVHRFTDFKEGDKVIVYSNQLPKNTETQVGKWLPIFEGPYIVKSVLGNGSYLLEQLDGRERGKFHTNMIHSYKDSDIWLEDG